MVFDYNQYYTTTLIHSIIKISIVVVLIVIFIIVHGIFSKQKGSIFAYLIILYICFSLIISAIGNLKYGIHLIQENEKDYISIIGEIQNIERVKHSSRYYYEGEAVGDASIVTINGEKLYFMTIGDLEIGDYIEVEYLPKSTFVLKVELFTGF